jgi:hypothetical protein
MIKLKIINMIININNQMLLFINLIGMIRIKSNKLLVKIINLINLLAQYLKLAKDLHPFDQMMKEILLLKNMKMAVDIRVLKVMV